jgi:hypothetical protein
MRMNCTSIAPPGIISSKACPSGRMIRLSVGAHCRVRSCPGIQRRKGVTPVAHSFHLLFDS